MQQSDSKLPKHIAIIMDGNGRWATNRKLPRHAGHKTGVESVERIVEACSSLNIEVLTLFAFSSENWRRPKEEVGLLMRLLLTALKSKVKRLHRNNVRLKVIGELSELPEPLQKAVDDAEAMTRDNTGLKLNVATNYGGRWDITQAMRQVAARVASGELNPQDVNESEIDKALAFYNMPDPDLFIRTGGESRISNFLLWQLAYTELYFTDLLWPEFDRVALENALDWYASRQRRFGCVPDATLDEALNQGQSKS